MAEAKKFADDYLSDPDTNLTTVRLLSLTDSDFKDISFDSEKAVVKCSMLEHLLAVVPEQNSTTPSP